MIYISNIDLENRIYNENDLIININHLHKRILVHTQHLSSEFCLKYILSSQRSGNDDSIIDINYILSFQKHLSWNDFIPYLLTPKS